MVDNQQKISSRDVVKDWISKHPNGTKHDCIKETGLPWRVVNPYWPYNVDTKDERDHKIMTEVIKWFSDNPGKDGMQCHLETGISKTYITRFRPDDSPSKAKIRAWLENNNHDDEDAPARCAKDTSVNESTVRRYWMAILGYNAPTSYSRNVNRYRQQVLDWVSCNPKGTIAQCSAEVGLSRDVVSKIWNEIIIESHPLPTMHDTKGQIESWFLTHPNGSVSDCATDLMISKSTVAMYRRELVREGLFLGESDHAKVAEWFNSNFGRGTINACAEANDISRGLASRHYHQIVSPKSKTLNLPTNNESRQLIKSWIGAHPGNLDPVLCAAELKLPLTRVKYYWRTYIQIASNPDFGSHVRNWQQQHPYDGIAICAREMGLEEDDIAPYWSDLNTPDLARGMFSLREVIAEWRSLYPSGTREECERDLDVSIGGDIWKRNI